MSQKSAKTPKKSAPAPKTDLVSKIQAVLDELRPAIQMDGGDVSFVNYDAATRVVTIALHGACQGCPMSEITLKQGIAQTIQDRLPEVADVVTESEV